MLFAIWIPIFCSKSKKEAGLLDRAYPSSIAERYFTDSAKMAITRRILAWSQLLNNRPWWDRRPNSASFAVIRSTFAERASSHFVSFSVPSRRVVPSSVPCAFSIIAKLCVPSFFRLVLSHAEDADARPTIARVCHCRHGVILDRRVKLCALVAEFFQREFSSTYNRLVLGGRSRENKRVKGEEEQLCIVHGQRSRIYLPKFLTFPTYVSHIYVYACACYARARMHTHAILLESLLALFPIRRSYHLLAMEKCNDSWRPMPQIVLPALFTHEAQREYTTRDIALVNANPDCVLRRGFRIGASAINLQKFFSHTRPPLYHDAIRHARIYIRAFCFLPSFLFQYDFKLFASSHFLFVLNIIIISLIVTPFFFISAFKVADKKGNETPGTQWWESLRDYLLAWYFSKGSLRLQE